MPRNNSAVRKAERRARVKKTPSFSEQLFFDTFVIQNDSYFDAVLDDRNMPVINGTPDVVKGWLNTHLSDLSVDHVVCIGRTMQVVSVSHYLSL